MEQIAKDKDHAWQSNRGDALKSHAIEKKSPGIEARAHA
jgi:hypothetical protein